MDIMINRNDVIVRKNKWIPIKWEETLIYISQYKITLSAIHRTQSLVMLSWTCTVHKVQGLSLNEGDRSFDLER